MYPVSNPPKELPRFTVPAPRVIEPVTWPPAKGRYALPHPVQLETVSATKEAFRLESMAGVPPILYPPFELTTPLPFTEKYPLLLRNVNDVPVSWELKPPPVDITSVEKKFVPVKVCEPAVSVAMPDVKRIVFAASVAGALM